MNKENTNYVEAIEQAYLGLYDLSTDMKKPWSPMNPGSQILKYKEFTERLDSQVELMRRIVVNYNDDLKAMGYLSEDSNSEAYKFALQYES